MSLLWVYPLSEIDPSEPFRESCRAQQNANQKHVEGAHPGPFDAKLLATLTP
jgi:hypothetical protein